MEGKREIRAEAPLQLGGVTVVPISELRLRGWSSGDGLSACGVKRPLGVIVVSAGGRVGFKVTGQAVPADRLEQEFPGLAMDSR
jgi:hypothetical protein